MDLGHPKGIFTSWPGLMSKAVAKCLPKSIATSKGHLGQTRKNIRSTQSSKPKIPEPEVEQLEQPTHLLFASIKPIGRVYTDQNRRFLVTSISGQKYICILYEYDVNAILAKPIKSRTGTDILCAYTKIHTFITKQGFKPRTHWLDNEAAQIMKNFDTYNDVTY